MAEKNRFQEFFDRVKDSIEEHPYVWLAGGVVVTGVIVYFAFSGNESEETKRVYMTGYPGGEESPESPYPKGDPVGGSGGGGGVVGLGGLEESILAGQAAMLEGMSEQQSDMFEEMRETQAERDEAMINTLEEMRETQAERDEAMINTLSDITDQRGQESIPEADIPEPTLIDDTRSDYQETLERKVTVNQGVRGREVQEKVGSVLDRQKERFDKKMKDYRETGDIGSLVWAGRVQKETEQATGTKLDTDVPDKYVNPPEGQSWVTGEVEHGEDYEYHRESNESIKQRQKERFQRASKRGDKDMAEQIRRETEYATGERVNW